MSINRIERLLVKRSIAKVRTEPTPIQPQAKNYRRGLHGQSKSEQQQQQQKYEKGRKEKKTKLDAQFTTGWLDSLLVCRVSTGFHADEGRLIVGWLFLDLRAGSKHLNGDLNRSKFTCASQQQQDALYRVLGSSYSLC